MWGLQTQARGEHGNGEAPWLPRTKQTTYKKYMTTAKKLRALTTYVKRRYSGDPYNVEDHNAIESDETVERMTNELGCDMPKEGETLEDWMTNRKGEMLTARLAGRGVVRNNQTKQNADFLKKWRKIMEPRGEWRTAKYWNKANQSTRCPK